MQKLAWVTVIATLLGVLWSSVTNFTGMGGGMVFGAYGLVVQILILWTAIRSFRLGAGKLLLALIVLEAAVMIGFMALRPDQEPAGAALSNTVNTLLLLTGIFKLAFLVALATASSGLAGVGGSDKLKRLSAAGIGALALQLALGGIVFVQNAGLACPSFPGCSDSFFPIPFTLETGSAFFHRWLGILLLGIFVHLPIAARKTAPALTRAAWTACGLGLFQVVLGVTLVLTHLHPHTRAMHAFIADLLWVTLIYIAVRSNLGRPLWLRSTIQEASKQS